VALMWLGWAVWSARTGSVEEEAAPGA